jgi:transposase
MMGSQGAGQAPLFYAFNLEDHIPADHLLRGIDRFLDLSALRQHLSSFYSHTGRPSIDPELMIRILVIGYCFGIRSERRLCEEVHLNLAYRWFCRLGLEDRIPDHSTFSKNRHGRFRQSDAFRHVFETVLRRCMGEGLVGGEGFAIDASVIKADANRARGVPGGQEINWSQGEGPSRAVREYLSALDASNPTDDDEPPAPPSGSSSAPKNISLTDPAARWTAAPGGPAFYAYSTNYLIDLDAGIIVDVEATPAHRTEEVESTKTMIERVERRFDLKPKRLVGDTAYGTAPDAQLDRQRQAN